MKLVFVSLLSLLAATAVSAADFSFQGAFTADDNVQLFNFTVGSSSTVTLRSWSYAGGVDAAGVTIPRGGFDPILALFDSTGAYISQNDDDETGTVPADAVTGKHYDVYLQSTLAAGNYTVSVMEYDNFAKGPNLSNGFDESGNGNFTSDYGCSEHMFCDVSGVPAGNSRTGNWEFDILGVNSASIPAGGVPEPGSIGLLLLGAGVVAGFGRKKLFARR